MSVARKKFLTQLAYVALLAVYCIPHGSDPVTRCLWEYARWGHMGDVERLFSYANWMSGASVDLGKLQRWNGDIGTLSDFLPTSRVGLPLLPYRDFALEYPPVCVPFFWLPRLLVSTIDAYRSLFALEMSLLHVAALALAARWVRAGKEPIDRLQTLWLLTLLALAALGPLVVGRLDALLSALLMGALLAARQERPAFCGCLIGLAAGAKLLPLLLLPAFFLHWWSRGQRRSSGRCLLGFSLATLLIFGPAALVGGTHFGHVFAYHSQRPVEIESVYGSLMLVDLCLGGPETVVQAFGCRCVRAPYEQSVLALAAVMPLLLCGGVLMLYRRQLGALEPHDGAARAKCLLRAVVALLVSLLLTLKVLSPQYLIPLIPMIFLLEDRPAARQVSDRLMLLCCLLTQLVFPIFWRSLEAASPLAVLLLLVRNGTLVSLWWVVLSPWLSGRRS